MKELILKIVSSEAFATTVASVIGAVYLWFNRRKAADSKAADREDKVASATDIAFAVVNDLAAMTTTKIDDKIAEGVKAFRAYLATHKIDPTPEEVERAKLVFSAFHGQGR